MPRKGPAPKRQLINDPVYGSPLVTQLVNKILLDGKKTTAERIVYSALEICREKTGTDPVITLKKALDNVRPALEVRSRRVGGATYQVPVEVRPGRSTTLAMRWLVTFSGSVARTRWSSVSPTRSWTPPTAWVPRSSVARTRTRWPRPTGRSRTTAGDPVGPWPGRCRERPPGQGPAVTRRVASLNKARTGRTECGYRQ